jgi:hypothetical protein
MLFPTESFTICLIFKILRDYSLLWLRSLEKWNCSISCLNLCWGGNGFSYWQYSWESLSLHISICTTHFCLPFRPLGRAISRVALISGRKLVISQGWWWWWWRESQKCKSPIRRVTSLQGHGMTAVFLQQAGGPSWTSRTAGSNSILLWLQFGATCWYLSAWGITIHRDNSLS